MATQQSPNSDTQKQSTHERFRYLTGFARVSIFYFIGLSLFFIAGFLVITMRVSVKEENVVPPVIGKLFLDEFNRLSELGLKIDIERYYSTEYPFGFIMAQSLPAGKIVKEGAKLTLLVNQSENVIQVPKFVGISEDLVDGMLANIPVGGRTFKLHRGVVTRVNSQRPKGEVLEQSPPAGTSVVPNTPVSLLVSDGPLAKGQAFKVPPLNQVPVQIVRQIAYELKRPMVWEVQTTQLPEQDGLTTAALVQDEIKATVLRYEPPANRDKTLSQDELPFRLVWLDANKIGKGKTVTLVSEKSNTQANADYIEEVLTFGYIKVGDAPIPLFLRTHEAIQVYEGYYVPEQGNETEVETPEGATPVMGNQQSVKPQVTPLKTIVLESGDV